MFDHQGKIPVEKLETGRTSGTQWHKQEALGGMKHTDVLMYSKLSWNLHFMYIAMKKLLFIKICQIN